MKDLFSRMQFAPINVSTLGDNPIVAAQPNKKIRVMNYLIIAKGTVDTTFKSGTTALEGPNPLVVNSGSCPESTLGQFETAAGEALNLNLSAAIQVSGHVGYIVL